MLQAWKNVAPDLVSNVESRGSKGDFLASVIRNDLRDRRLAEAFKRNYELITSKKQKTYTGDIKLKDSQILPPMFYLENVEINQISGNQFPSLPKMVELSQLWMSDHAHFWYFLQKEVKASLRFK